MSFFVEINNLNENDFEEFNVVYDFGDVGDEMFESDEVGNVDDFVEYGVVDEIVFLKYWDFIVEVLREKCKEMKLKKKLMNEEKLEENVMGGGWDLK